MTDINFKAIWRFPYSVLSRRRSNPRRNGLELGVWVVVLALFAVIGYIITRHGATQVVSTPIAPPSSKHWFGIDSYGMDIFSRVLYAARIDIGVALISGIVVFTLAFPTALFTGFWSNWASKLVLRLLDILQSFPALILALTVVALTGNGVPNLVLASGFVFGPVFVRVVRAVVLSVREEPYVESAIACGVRPIVVVLRHVVPQAIGAALAQVTIAVSRTLVLVAGLAFIGVGIQPPTPEWGSMVQAGVAAAVNGKWWVSAYPGAAIVVTVLIFNRMGTLLQRVTAGGTE